MFSHSNSTRDQSRPKIVITRDHRVGDRGAHDHVHRGSGRRYGHAIQIRPANHAYGAALSI